MKKNILMSVFLLFPCILFAQYVTYDIEESIIKAQEKHIEANKNVDKVTIFCIQVGSFSGENSSGKAVILKNETEKQLAGISVPTEIYIIFDAPNHKVRIGNFFDRMEAYHVLNYVQQTFPGAFVTRDKRKVEDIIK
ncbi:MAG TPA: hypothetical protein PKK66_00465 [Bacteroidales bacterium]|nr:hypothetical protein [Bacteroidales bacterium]HPT51684.1 hypothetical protein [Bacteroidales bacterium]